MLYADAVWLCAFLLPTFFAFTGLKNPMKPIQGQQAFWHCFLATTTDRIIVNRIIQGKFTNLEANIEMETLIEHEKRQLNLLEKSRDVGSDLLLQVQSTILNVVKADKVLYVSIVCYILVRLCVIGDQCSQNDLFADNVTGLGFVVGFVFSYFVSICFSRYWQYFDDGVSLPGLFQNILLTCRRLEPTSLKKLCCFLNASHIAFYTQYFDYLNFENFFVPMVQKYDLLETSEVEYLKTFQNSNEVCRVILTWGMDIILNDSKAGLCHPPIIFSFFDVRNSYNRLNNAKITAVPFIHIHFLYGCVAIFLPLYSIGAAMTVTKDKVQFALVFIETATFLTTVFVCIFFLGLLRLGLKLQTPYRSDESGLGVMVLDLIDRGYEMYPIQRSASAIWH